MSVLNTILGTLKSGLETITVDNGYNTTVVNVFDYPISITNLPTGDQPCLVMLVDEDARLTVYGSDGRRFDITVSVTGKVHSDRSTVQVDTMDLLTDVKDYIDGVTASDLGSGCLDISWQADGAEILRDQAAFTIDLTIIYFAAKGSN